jgi:hypothetical protein
LQPADPRIGEFAKAISDGDLEKVKAMLKAKPELVFIKGELGNTFLHNAATAGNGAVAELLLANKADVNAANDMGHTPLYCARSSDSGGKVEKVLLAHGASADASDLSDGAKVDAHNGLVAYDLPDGGITYGPPGGMTIENPRVHYPEGGGQMAAMIGDNGNMYVNVNGRWEPTRISLKRHEESK